MNLPVGPILALAFLTVAVVAVAAVLAALRLLLPSQHPLRVRAASFVSRFKSNPDFFFRNLEKIMLWGTVAIFALLTIIYS